MVKLSEILRKSTIIGYEEKPGIISEAIETKKDKQSLAEIKKIYEDVILHLMLILDKIKEGKAVEGRKVTNLAEVIIDVLRDSSDILLSLVNIFASLGKEEDFLYAHSVNISILASNLGIALGYDRSELVDLCASSLLHDIGYLRIPKKIINKPSKLTEEEYGRIKKHPIYGVELLDNIKSPPECASEVVHQHHERVDGTGYPDGKRGEEISEYAKIVAIVEVYEALTHPRPYRKEKIIPYEGVKIIIQKERKSFDPELVKVFLNSITPYPPGSFVLLSNKEIGRVFSINKNLPLRPVVEIFFDSDGTPPEKPTRIDLSRAHILYIDKALDENDL